MNKILLIAFGFIISTSLYADIWKDRETWSPRWERKYAIWMSSPSVNKNMFVSRKSKYYGINADCADAIYAFRAIFSYENKLPFKVLNPSGSRSGKYKYLTNRTSKFDGAGRSSVKKVVAMINYLGDGVGTEHLNHHDTHPIKISAISGGTLFTYKILRGGKKVIRHAYSITSVTEYGDYNVIYSSQAIAKGNLPLRVRKSHSFSNKPHGVWGFKRFKWPQHEGRSNSSLPSEVGYSQEQYELVRRYGRKFFAYVKNRLKTKSEEPNSLLKRKLRLLCIEGVDRIENVNQGYQHHVKTGGRCMNYADFDAYSTPARDAALKASFERFQDDFETIRDNGDANQVDFKTWEMSKAIVRGYSAGSQVDSDLYEACTLKYRSGKRMHLAELRKRVKSGVLSSHPNDKLPQRWGETTRNRTSCKVWY